jgi:hypothetical protein
VAVGLILPRAGCVVETDGVAGRSGPGLTRLRALRSGIYGCFTRRADALFELCDAMVCASGPVLSPVELSLEPEFRRGHAMVYDALSAGRVDADRLRRVLVGALPAARAGEPLMFGVDVSPLPRPDPRYVDGLSMVQVRGSGGDRLLPGWPVSILVGLSWGASSWVDPLDARRIAPGGDHTAVLLAQAEGLLADLHAAGCLGPGAVAPLVMFDSGYPATQIAYALAARGAQVLGRVRADRVFYFPAPPTEPGRGRPARHGDRFECANPATHPEPEVRVAAHAERYGRIEVAAWYHLHQALSRTGGWAGYPAGQALPVVEGTLIRVTVQRLGHKGAPKPMWLWHHAPPGTRIDVDLLWKGYLRRFDQEHFHRFAKVHLGLARARLLAAEAVDRWIALVIAGYAQLRVAAPLVSDQPRPWQRATAPGRVPTPCRVRAGFRRLRADLGTPAGVAKIVRPGTGRPPGRKNPVKPRRPVYNKSDIALMACLAREAPPP